MVKTKNKKKTPISDKVRAKKKDQSTKVNPFEVKFNKQKHHVLGKKTAKFDKGRPGVSRSKAIQKRKETLLVEYKQSGKVNTLMDKRIGEGDPDMTVEEKMLQRFSAERKKTQGNAGTFNLNDEDDLTHYGQSLSQIENFDDPISSGDEDDEDRGKIGAKMVAEEHFGGGMLKKTDSTDSGKHKTWKERMEEIIAKSKKEKYARQHEKEIHREVADKLDKEWNELRSLMASMKKGDETRGKKEVDDYDKAVRELHYEMKGQATDRMKTEEELASEEKARLEKLEADRLLRMKGVTAEDEEEKSRQRKHYSADDLDDGFSLDTQEKFEVRYKDGKMITQDDGSDDDSDQEQEAGEENEGINKTDEEESDDDSDDDEKADSDEDDDDDDNEDESDSGDDAMAHLSDLESEDENDNEDDGEDEKQDSEVVMKEGKTKEENIKDMLKKKKAVMEEARKELPYTFKAPESYEDLLNTLKDHSTIDKVIIIERIRTCNHASLVEGNKSRLETLFQLLLKYYGDLSLKQPPDFRLIDKLVIHLYELAQQSPVAAGKAVLDLVIERQNEFQERCEAKNGKGQFPTHDMVLYFKLISILFPTSDLQHPVVTPALLFMSQIITQSAVQTTRDVALGLLLCNIFLEYVSFSKRFVPEVINFLRGLLFLCIKKDSPKIEPVIPPFKPVGKFNDILNLKSKMLHKEGETIEPMLLSDIFTPRKAMSYLMSDKFRLSSIKLTISLLNQFSTLYNSLPSYREIFQPVCYFCKKLPSHHYPKSLQDDIQKLIQEIEMKAQKKDRRRLSMAKVRTKALKLYEPKVDESFDPTRKSHADRGKDKNEKQRLIHKHKKELKGAIREIRKDSQFLANEKLTDQISRDTERKRKVRELIGSLATQEGDYKAMKRHKSKP